MRTILYLTLTANGGLAQTSEARPIPREILADFVGIASKVGNLIVGSRTYDVMRGLASRPGFPNIKLVVVSHARSESGVATASSPKEALHFLEREGFDAGLVGGGAQLDSSFLSQGLVDEIYLNIEPSLSGGNLWPISDGFEAELRLAGTTKLSDNVIQLHYTRA